MNTARFTALLCFGMVAVMILAGPSWLRYWKGEGVGPTTTAQRADLSEETMYWKPTGEVSNTGSHANEVVSQIRFYRSAAHRESSGLKEQMVFAEVTIKNESPTPVSLQDVTVHGFDKNIRIFEVGVVKIAAPGVLIPAGASQTFSSDGTFIPSSLVHERLTASIIFNN